MMMRAGAPTATAPAGTSRSTTLLAPTFDPDPTWIAPSTTAPAPISTWSPNVGSKYDLQGVEADALIDFTPEMNAEAKRIASNYIMGPIFTPPPITIPSG